MEREDRLELAADGGKTQLRLRVKPGARHREIRGVRAGALEVSVTAPPERGRANRAVLELLAEVLGVAPSRIELVRGHAGREKTIRVPLPPETVRERLKGPP